MFNCLALTEGSDLCYGIPQTNETIRTLFFLWSKRAASFSYSHVFTLFTDIMQEITATNNTLMHFFFFFRI